VKIDRLNISAYFVINVSVRFLLT